MNIFPPSRSSGSNHAGAGLCASTAAKEIESVGQARGRFGADECVIIQKHNDPAASAANSGVACPAPESLSKYDPIGAPFDEPMATASGAWCEAAIAEPEQVGC